MVFTSHRPTLSPVSAGDGRNALTPLTLRRVTLNGTSAVQRQRLEKQSTRGLAGIRWFGDPRKRWSGDPRFYDAARSTR